MSIFNYIYRRPFSFSDPTQKIQSQQQQKTYQRYCHLNDLMIKSTWLPVRKKKGGGGRGGSDRLDYTKTCLLVAAHTMLCLMPVR